MSRKKLPQDAKHFGWRKLPQAAEHFGVSPRTLRTLMRQGFSYSRLPTGTIMVEIEAGDDWLRARQEQDSLKDQAKQLLAGMK